MVTWKLPSIGLSASVSVLSILMLIVIVVSLTTLGAVKDTVLPLIET